MAAFRRRNLLATVAAAAAAAVSVLVASPGVVAQAPQPRTGISRNNAVFAGRKGDVDRIINGRIVTKDDEDYGAHFMVKLLYEKDGLMYFYCGGSLISPNKVLTAAHCIEGIDVVLAGDVVRVGGLTINSGFERKITRAAMHPQFNSGTLDYDLAVLTFADPPTAAEYRAAGVKRVVYNAQGSQPTLTSDLKIAGWGNISGLRQSISNSLRLASVKMNTWQSCSDYYNAKFGFRLSTASAKLQICASTQDKTATCNGDSGGPLFQRLTTSTGATYYKVYGVVSYGYPSGSNACPVDNSDFFARTNAGTTFIKSEM